MTSIQDIKNAEAYGYLTEEEAKALAKRHLDQQIRFVEAETKWRESKAGQV